MTAMWISLLELEKALLIFLSLLVLISRYAFLERKLWRKGWMVDRMR
jgi:hypothetical protein